MPFGIFVGQALGLRRPERPPQGEALPRKAGGMIIPSQTLRFF